jgi:hypothetical protein
MSTPTFEDRLLNELQDVLRAQAPSHSGRPHRVRNRSLAGAAVAAAATTVAALVLTGSASAAYAIDVNNGTVTVTIKSLKDSVGLRKALRDKGILAFVDYTPAGKTCQQPRGQIATDQNPVSSSVRQGAGPATFSINPGTLKPGEVIVIESSGGNGPSSIGIQLIQGSVAACTLVDAPAAPADGVTHSVTSGGTGNEGSGTVTRHTG